MSNSGTIYSGSSLLSTFVEAYYGPKTEVDLGDGQTKDDIFVFCVGKEGSFKELGRTRFLIIYSTKQDFILHNTSVY